MPLKQPAFTNTSSKRESTRDAPCLFEVVHGDTVIRVADDWGGHVLIEKLYVALREARQARDKAALLKGATALRHDKPAENIAAEKLER